MHPCCHLDDITIPKSPVSVTLYLSFLKILFVYLTERERERERKLAEWQAEEDREAGLLPSSEPDAGLNPRTLGSRPEPKAYA